MFNPFQLGLENIGKKKSLIKCSLIVYIGEEIIFSMSFKVLLARLRIKLT